MASVRPEAPQKGTVFVSDPSAEAERVAQALRAAGYTVVDVPLSILVARVAVQRPRVVVVDADGEGALETVGRMRELADSESIDILFMGRLGAAFQVPEEALMHEGSGFFARPVDAEAVVRKVNALMQVSPSNAPAPATAAEAAAVDASWKEPEREKKDQEQKKDRDPDRDLGKDKERDKEKDRQPAPRGSVPPLAQVSNDARKNASSKPPLVPAAASAPSPEKKAESETSAQPAPSASPQIIDEPSSAPPSSKTSSEKPPASLPSPGIRESPSAPPPSMSRPSRAPSQPPPPSMPAIMRARKGAQGPLSEELMQLLAEAEERLGGEAVGYDLPSLSPEEEIDAVLPEEILAALDDPLEEEDEEEANDSALGSQGRVTTSGGNKQTTGASRRHTTGVADAGTGSVGQPPSEVGSAPTALVASTGPFGVRAPLSPTVAPHAQHTTSAISGAISAPATTQGDSALRAFRPPSEPAPHLFSQSASFAQPASDPQTSPRAAEARHPSSHPPSTAMAPTAAGFTLGSDVLMPVAMALEAAQEARREAMPQPVLIGAQIPPMPLRDLPPQLVPSSNVASSQNMVPSSTTTEIPAVLGPHDAPRAIARAIATRTTGTLCLESKEGVRRVVMREGDLVTAASGVDDESLIAFLVEHGDLPRESLQALAGRFATFGRHAGAALVAQGYLRQDQLWPVLRAHAEWILGRALAIDSGTALMEPDAPGRLKAEPSVFGGSTGAEVFVDVVRRVISQDDAFARMGGGQARIGEGRNANLLTECALGAPEIAVLEQLRGLTLAQAVASAPDTDMIAVLYALHLLGVIEVLRSLGGAVPSSRDRSNEPRIDTLDDEAIRARIRARLDLVEEGDYFAVLGVARTATSYEVRRAFTELRRAFDPDRILTPSMVDLGPQVRKIVAVLEEAYDILHDSARRDRYRRAIDTMN
ncbi:MAG: DUF4388 domain-containing protein [Polyangiaceae bacterium]